MLVRQCHPPRGAERSLFALARRLGADHDVRLFGFRDGPAAAVQVPVPATVRPFPSLGDGSALDRAVHSLVGPHRLAARFRRDVGGFDPDLVVAQHEHVHLAAWLRARRRASAVLFLRDPGQLERPDLGDSAVPNAAKRAKSRVRWASNLASFLAADLVVANSAFTADAYAERYPGLEPRVVYPFVEADAFRGESDGDAILHVTPTRAKGIDVTLDVAEALPDESFLVAGTDPEPAVRERMDRLDNVEFLGFVEEMASVYGRSKLALCPSRWPEPFGRVPIEAGLARVPTLCSGTGGLCEAVGEETFVVASNDPEAYVARIEAVLDEHERFSRLARSNAEAKAADRQVERFRELVRSEVGLEV